MTKAVRRIGPAPEIKESINTIETPSSQAIKAAQKDIEVPDSFGRIIKVRAITALQRMRMFEAIGALSRNEMYLGHASLACSVIAIDGEPVRFPSSNGKSKLWSTGSITKVWRRPVSVLQNSTGPRLTPKLGI